MKPPTFIECTVCGREFGSKSITIHERQCLQKLRRTEICDERDTSFGEKVKKKGIPVPASAVSKATALPKDRSPTPQILLPKISTEFGRRSKHCPAIRPTTATLAKPKFLNPEYIKHDMSLTRIDYSAAQLRLTDGDENHNFSSNRCNFVLPTVGTGQKSKIPSPPRGFERGLVKFPDSNAKSTYYESKKHHSADSSVMVMLPISECPRSSEFDPLTSQSSPVTKSRSFPLLPSQRAFLLKQLKSSQSPFPQIPNDRSSLQSSSKYFLTPTLQLPGNGDEDGHGGGSRFQHYCHADLSDILYLPKSEDSEEFGHRENLLGTGAETGSVVPEAVLEKDVDGFSTISEQSICTQSEESFETLFVGDICSVTASASPFKYREENPEKCSLKGISEFFGRKDDNKCVKKECDILEKCNSGQMLEQCRKNLPVSFATPICVNMCQATNPASYWLFGNTLSSKMVPSPILKNRIISPESSSIGSVSLERSPRVIDDASSGTERGNEDTSSGYCLLRTIPSSRTVLRKRLRRKKRCSNFQTELKRIPPPEKPTPITNEVTVCEIALPTEELSNHTTERSRLTRCNFYEKVSKWLEDCAIARGRDEAPFCQVSNPPSCEEPSTVNSFQGIWQPKKVPSLERTKKSPVPKDPDKVISGLVTVTFKVHDSEETRTYNFVKEIRKSTAPPIKGSNGNKIHHEQPSKVDYVLSTSSEALFRRYAPPKNLQRNKRILKMLKTVQTTTFSERPKTAPVPSNYLNSVQANRPKNSASAAKESRKITNPVSPTAKPNAKISKNSTGNVFQKRLDPSSTVPILELKQTVTLSPKVRATGHRHQAHLTFKDINLRSSEGQGQALLWTRPKSQKLDKSSQAPETRSTFVQYY